jgi:hypothetical protein
MLCANAVCDSPAGTATARRENMAMIIAVLIGLALMSSGNN